jgi:hypothetical protein
VDTSAPKFELKVPVGNPETQLPPRDSVEVSVMDTVVNANNVQMIVRSKVGAGIYVARTALETRDRWILWEWGTFGKVDTKSAYRPMTQQEKESVLSNMMGDEPPPQEKPMPVAQPPRFANDYSKAALIPDYLERIMSRFSILPDVSNDFRVAVDFLKTVNDEELVRLVQENALTSKAETSYNAIALQLELILKAIEEFLHQVVGRANELD